VKFFATKKKQAEPAGDAVQGAAPDPFQASAPAAADAASGGADTRAQRILRAIGASSGPDDRAVAAPAANRASPLSGPAATIPIPGRQEGDQSNPYGDQDASRLSQASVSPTSSTPAAAAPAGDGQYASIIKARASESASSLLGPTAAQQFGVHGDSSAAAENRGSVVIHRNMAAAEQAPQPTLVLDQVAPSSHGTPMAVVDQHAAAAPAQDFAASQQTLGQQATAQQAVGQQTAGQQQAVGQPANDRVMQAPPQPAGPGPAKVQPLPPQKQQAEPGWSTAEAPRGNDDPLLDCLVIMTAIFERPHSADALSAGLPLVDDRLTPDLFVRAAARAGLSARIVKRTLPDITNMSLPAVLLLKGGKACVLIKQEDGRASVVLPETGPGVTQISGERLASMYAGYVLFAKPEFQFDQRSEATEVRPTKDWFWGTLKKFWRIYAQVGVAAFFVNLFAIATPLFVMNVYDRVVPTKGQETLWVLVMGVSVIFAFEFALRWLRSYFTDTAGRSADVIMASMIFQQILGVKMASRPASAGAFANQLREFETLRDFFTSATMVTLIDLPFIFLFITLIYIIGGPVAIVPLLAVPIVIGAGLVIQKPLTKVVTESARESAQKHALLVESIVGLETIKSLGAEGRTQRTWERFVGETSKSGMKARSLSQLAMFITTLTTQFTTIAVVVVGVYLIFSGDMTVGALIACTILTGRAMAPLGQVAALMTRFNQSMVSLKTLDQLMQMPVERPVGSSFVHRPNLKGSIEFRNVTFAYPNQQINALENVSFNVKAGEKVGVIGKIGSGKSTIERLALGLYQPQSGSIRIDGTDIQQIDPADLRRNIGYVSQDIFLFYGSVRENIAVGAPHADDAAILRAARLSGVDNFVSKHPQGFDLNVGERGESLSGGQRQSISIARAFVRNPSILILDEPTSAMDKGSEDWFINRLREYMVGRTVFVVTQRVSLLTLVDRLLVMDGGGVVAEGPRDTVLEMLARGQIKGAGE